MGFELEDFRKYLKNFRLAKFLLEIEVGEHGIELPPYKGSTFRGGFGQAFKNMVCTMKKNKCTECLLNENCPYCYIFETTPKSQHELLKKFNNIPRPYIIEPPLDTKTYYKPSERICFNLVLIGKSIDLLPYFVVAFDELGRIGIGRGRKPFKLRKIFAEDKNGKIYKVYTEKCGKIRNSNVGITGSDIINSTEKLKNVDQITLEFNTPVRIKHNKSLLQTLDFYIIVKSLLRRFSNLSYFHQDTPVSIDFQTIIESCKDVQIIEDKTKWIDWVRYSRRQDSRMRLGGLVGEITYTGELSSYLPLLILGEYIHVGKSITFGLGKYRLKV